MDSRRSSQPQAPAMRSPMRSLSLSAAEAADMAGLWASGALARSHSAVAAEYSWSAAADQREARRQPRTSHHGGSPPLAVPGCGVSLRPAHHRGSVKRASSLSTLLEAGDGGTSATVPGRSAEVSRRMPPPEGGAEHTRMYGMLLSEIEGLLQERQQLVTRHRCLVAENSQLAEMVGRLSLALRDAQAGGGSSCSAAAPAAHGGTGHPQALPRHASAHKPPLSRQNSAPARSSLVRQGSQDAASAHAAFLQQQGRDRQQQPYQRYQQEQQRLHHQLVSSSSSSSDSASNASGSDATFSPEDEL